MQKKYQNRCDWLSQTDDCFGREIEKIEHSRLNLLKIMIKNKQEVKQNMKAYLTKKTIISSTLKSQPLKAIRLNIQSFKHGIPVKRTQSIYQPQDCSVSQTKQQSKANQMQNHCVQAHQNAANQVPLERNKLQKWKLEITSEEKNGLYFGKQLKIGENARKIYLSDDKLEKIKNNILIRRKKKPTSVYNKQKSAECPRNYNNPMTKSYTRQAYKNYAAMQGSLTIPTTPQSKASHEAVGVRKDYRSKPYLKKFLRCEAIAQNQDPYQHLLEISMPDEMSRQFS